MSIALHRVRVLDSEIAFREAGPAGATPVLFLHGNPTSSYIWRNVIPHVEPYGHCIAPDLIGFGASGKPDIAYRFADHVRFLDAFLDVMRIGRVIVVAQDWGTALAFHLARRSPDRVLGLAFMEFIRPVASLEELHQAPQARAMFQRMRTPIEGERLVMEDNVFIERILPGSVVRTLAPEELEAYRAPFPTVGSRKPVWRFPNELPIAGEPADVDAVLRDAHAALKASWYPKMLICGNPGAVTAVPFAEQFAASLHDCRLVQLASGRHYLQEDEPDAIGLAVASFVKDIAPGLRPRTQAMAGSAT